MDVFNVTADAEQFTCNAYLVTGERTVLVDAGSMPGVADVVADHVEALDAVCERFDPDVYAYAEHPLRTHDIDDGDSVEMGDETFEVVYTPGHAADHVSLVGETTLFSGDVVVYNDGAFDNGSFGRTDLPGQSRERLIQSISQLLDRLPESVTAMYAGHGDVFEADPDGDSVHDVVRRALLRAEERQPKYPDE